MPANYPDIIRWTPANNGICTAKDAYRFYYNQLQGTLPSHGPRSITQQALNILKRAWKHKPLSPCIKTFTWRLLRRALATGQRAGDLSSKISKQCAICNMTQNDSHLFFHYHFARAVWFSSVPPLLSSFLPQEQDGVQKILSTIITQHTTDDEFQNFLTALWHLWKARNDTRFKNKKWSVLQVHQAVATDIKVTAIAMETCNSIDKRPPCS